MYLDFLLDRLDQAAEWRLLNAKPLRRARDVAFFCDGDDIAEMPQFHSRFTLPFGYADATNIVFHNGLVLGRSLLREKKGTYEQND